MVGPSQPGGGAGCSRADARRAPGIFPPVNPPSPGVLCLRPGARPGEEIPAVTPNHKKSRTRPRDLTGYKGGPHVLLTLQAEVVPITMPGV